MLRSASGGGSAAGAVTTAGTLTAGQVAYGSGAQTITSSPNFTYVTNGALTVSGASGVAVVAVPGAAGVSGTIASAAVQIGAANQGFYCPNGVVLTATVAGAAVASWVNNAGLSFSPGQNSAATASLGSAGVGWLKLYLDYTITPAATTGNRTINKAAGSIRIAAAGTSVTLTNSLVTANSIVMATLATVDTAAKSVSATVSSTSVLFTLNAAASAEVEIRWFVVSTD